MGNKASVNGGCEYYTSQPMTSSTQSVVDGARGVCDCGAPGHSCYQSQSVCASYTSAKSCDAICVQHAQDKKNVGLECNAFAFCRGSGCYFKHIDGSGSQELLLDNNVTAGYSMRYFKKSAVTESGYAECSYNCVDSGSIGVCDCGVPGNQCYQSQSTCAG